MAATITDVAREAGVSVATVSRALRGLDRVSPATRARVIEAADKLDFVASPTAASLASGRTDMVAVVVPFLSRWFFSTVVSSIEKTLRERNRHVLLVDLEDPAHYDRRRELAGSRLFKRADGIIALNIPMTEAEAALVERLDVPLVTVGNRLGEHLHVEIDDAEAARMATEHLIDLGHTDIAYIGTVPETAAHTATPLARVAGYRRAMADAGIPVREEWVVDCDWTAEQAVHVATALLTADVCPTAILAASDEMAFGVYRAARVTGVSVPEQLSLVGIDDHYLSSVFEVTTVRQNVEYQGHVAAEALLDQLEGKAPTLPREIPLELIPRASSGPPPAGR